MQKSKRLMRKNIRTVFLALVATGTFAWSAIDIFNADPEELWNFFQMSLLGLLVVIGLAAFMTAIVKLFKR
jgi:hypothetical protein